MVIIAGVMRKNSFYLRPDVSSTSYARDPISGRPPARRP
jgi:hypothetical protein